MFPYWDYLLLTAIFSSHLSLSLLFNTQYIYHSWHLHLKDDKMHTFSSMFRFRSWASFAVARIIFAVCPSLSFLTHLCPGTRVHTSIGKWMGFASEPAFKQGSFGYLNRERKQLPNSLHRAFLCQWPGDQQSRRMKDKLVKVMSIQRVCLLNGSLHVVMASAAYTVQRV